MAYNPFIGWSQADLEQDLNLAQIDLAQGKTTTQAGDGNVMVKSHISASPEARIEMLLRALNKIIPSLYPLDQITRITSARVTFGDSLPSSTPQVATAANAITYSGPPVVNPPYIAAIVVDVDGRQWMFWGNAWQ